MKARLPIMVAAASVLLISGGCGDDDQPRVPNPAAVYCEQQGGAVSGSEPMCELPDGSTVDAWEFYRADITNEVGLANPAAVFCEEQGGTTSGPEPMCEMADGSVIDAWDYFRREGLED